MGHDGLAEAAACSRARPSRKHASPLVPPIARAPPPPPPPCRQAGALLAILQAGDEVEEVIAQCRADINATTLQVA